MAKVATKRHKRVKLTVPFWCFFVACFLRRTVRDAFPGRDFSHPTFVFAALERCFEMWRQFVIFQFLGIRLFV